MVYLGGGDGWVGCSGGWMVMVVFVGGVVHSYYCVLSKL